MGCTSVSLEQLHLSNGQSNRTICFFGRCASRQQVVVIEQFSDVLDINSIEVVGYSKRQDMYEGQAALKESDSNANDAQLKALSVN